MPKSIIPPPSGLGPGESIALLRRRVSGQRASLYGFDLNTSNAVSHEMDQSLKAAVTKLLTQWYGLQVVPFRQRASIIVCNEADPPALSRIIRQATEVHDYNPSVVVLCSYSSRFDRTASRKDSKYNVEFVAKPMGPLKLAKAILHCLEGVPSIMTPRLQDSPYTLEESGPPLHSSLDPSSSPSGGNMHDTSRGAPESGNMRSVIDSLEPNKLIEKDAEPHFPAIEVRTRPVPGARPNGTGSKSLVRAFSADAALAMTGIEKASSRDSHDGERAKVELAKSLKNHGPSLLLVDDNKINLKLLSTYMRRRNCGLIDEAENGLEAVEKVHGREEGYDIIFMDISMPILDGFKATRQIRTIEKEREGRRADLLQQKLPASVSGIAGESPVGHHVAESCSNATSTPALVIALTGLASERDRTEAAMSGINLFLTKPAALKEVGKLLDDWESSRELDAANLATQIRARLSLKESIQGLVEESNQGLIE
jgi:CheY-like chemotaxis protein